MTRTCNREGCCRPVYARAKCKSHFNVMIKSLRRKGSTLFAAVDTWTEIQKVMPGTLVQLTERSGITYNSIMRTIHKRHAAGEAYIVDVLPPQNAGGARWVNVWAVGGGPDKIVSEKRKKDHMRKRRREWHAERKASAALAASVIATRWNTAFFNPSKVFR